MERIGNLKEALADKTVLVTGAGRGLGHGVARGLAAYGATVVAVARTESELAGWRKPCGRRAERLRRSSPTWLHLRKRRASPRT